MAATAWSPQTRAEIAAAGAVRAAGASDTVLLLHRVCSTAERAAARLKRHQLALRSLANWIQNVRDKIWRAGSVVRCAEASLMMRQLTRHLFTCSSLKRADTFF